LPGEWHDEEHVLHPTHIEFIKDLREWFGVGRDFIVCLVTTKISDSAVHDLY
jgi:hypothetical protein